MSKNAWNSEGVKVQAARELLFYHNSLNRELKKKKKKFPKPKDEPS